MYFHIHIRVYIFIYRTKSRNKLIQIDQTIPPSGRWRHCGVWGQRQSTPAWTCRHSGLFVSRFRNNHEFHSCFFGDEFWKTWGLLFENKTCCLTNVLLDHFRLVGVWWLEKVITKSSPLRGWIAAVDCSGLNLLIVCIYIYYIIMSAYICFGVVHTYYILLIFLASLPCTSNVDSWIFTSSSREVYFLIKGLVVAPCDRWLFYLLWKKQGKTKRHFSGPQKECDPTVQ